ncbi:MAG: NlpC/P60 family protein, partial [bacterium]|nr:NlpC/P60 family protein [bacterium]
MTLKRLLSTAILVSAILKAGNIFAQQEPGPFDSLVKSLSGIEEGEQARLSRALTTAFAGEVALSPAQLTRLSHSLNAGLFEMSANTSDSDESISDADMVQIANAARVAHDAIAEGASPDRIDDLIPMAFSVPVTADQMGAAAGALDRLLLAGVSDAIARELVAQALATGWPAEVLSAVVTGFVAALQQGLDAEHLAVSLVVGVAQRPANVPVDALVSEAINTVRLGQDPIFEAVKAARNGGLPESLGKEIYYTAVEEGWPMAILQGVLAGLLRGQSLGLPQNQLATALIVRVSLGLDGLRVDEVVDQEIAYVRNLSQARIAEIRETVTGAKRPAQEEAKTGGQSGLQEISKALMASSVQDFIGTPYRWGGTARKRGVDCSGFTQGVYQDLSIAIPRISRDQFRGSPVKVPDTNNLQYGDLVFFNKYGGEDRYIT